MPLCCCCGFKEEKGIVFGEEAPRGSGNYQKSFVCERCAMCSSLQFPFTVLTIDGKQKMLFTPKQGKIVSSKMMAKTDWGQFEYGCFGNKACNLCERHLNCPKEHYVFIEKVLGTNRLYCDGFQLSEKVRDELVRRGFKQNP